MGAHLYPFSAPDRLNLDPFYAQLRDQPLVRVRLPFGEEAWLATRYDDVRTVLGDHLRFSRAESIGRDEPRSTPRSISEGFLVMDPPEHTRLRSLVARAFTSRRVEQMRPHAQAIADDLLDHMVAKGSPADLVENFATPLPIRVICDMLGVPHTDQDRFHVWSEAIVSTTSLPVETIQQYIEKLDDYIAGLIAQRRVTPADDLITALVRARDEEGDQLTEQSAFSASQPSGTPPAHSRQARLSEQELVRLISGLLAAGHETTVTQIPNFLYVLLTHPDKLAELRDNPELIPAAVEELMRYIPLGVAAAFPRYALEDLELGGVLVRAGEPVLASVAAANRDERTFPDADELSFTRPSNLHLGFGHGVHHCLGAQLARMELQVALASLLRRFPGLRLAVPESDLDWKKGLLVRGLKSLPVSW